MVRPTFWALLSALIFWAATPVLAQKPEDATSALDSNDIKRLMLQVYFDSVDKTIGYLHGTVPVGDVADVNLKSGYKFIPMDKAQMILHDLWGNPKRDDILGMVVKEDYKLSDLGAWAFVVSYEDDGYVKDEDADKIDYDELLKSMQEDEVESNKARVKEGYPEVHLKGWAAKPYYDKKTKVLHWAKNLQFGDEADPTLNYDVRILGRKGVLSMNAIGTIDQLADINNHIPDIVTMAVFKEGNKYADFTPGVDKVAAYTIGGLIAGKLIAKTGLAVLLLKNIKLILLALVGGFAGARKRIAGLFRRKKKEDDTAKFGPSAEELAEIERYNQQQTDDTTQA